MPNEITGENNGDDDEQQLSDDDGFGEPHKFPSCLWDVCENVVAEEGSFCCQEHRLWHRDSLGLPRTEADLYFDEAPELCESEEEYDFNEPPGKKPRSELLEHESDDENPEKDNERCRAWRILVETHSKPATLPAFQQPWERGFAGLIFGPASKTLPALRTTHYVPTADDFVSIGDSSSSTNGNLSAVNAQTILDTIDAVKGAWPVVAGRLASLTWADRGETGRFTALNRFKYFFQEAPEHTGLGRLLMKDIMCLQDPSSLETAIANIFSKKKTSTLVKRSASVAKYRLYCKERQLPVLPLQEAVVYRFMIEKCSGSASAAQTFKECLNFLSSTLQVDGAAFIAASPRVAGFAFAKQLTKRPLKQARTLTTVEVGILEEIVNNEYEELADRVMAGHCAWNVHGRLRWSDGQSVSCITLDLDDEGRGFVQGLAKDTKTAGSAAKRTIFLPVTALATGMRSNTWAQAWLSARRQAGLVFGKGPVMPCVTISGTFGTTELDTGTASKWLRELIRRGSPPGTDVSEISTHSLKSTALSWAAKFGIGREPRQVLGYHVVAGASSMMHYSRDEQAGPLRELQAAYDAILSGVFQPDRTRSGYIRRDRKEEVRQNAAASLPEDELSGTNTSGTDDEGSESGNDEALHELDVGPTVAPPPPEDQGRRRPAAGPSEEFFEHTLWKTVHKGSMRSKFVMACGRRLTASYRQCTPGPAKPQCLTCFGSSQ